MDKEQEVNIIPMVKKIFDTLLQVGQIKLSPNHTIPFVEELNK